MKEWFNKFMIKLCCAHKWSIITSIKTPPASGLKTDHIRCSEKLFLEILYGTQTVVFSCEKCGKIIEKDYIGESDERE